MNRLNPTYRSNLYFLEYTCILDTCILSFFKPLKNGPNWIKLIHFRGTIGPFKKGIESVLNSFLVYKIYKIY